MSKASPPSAREQILFLRRIQRLLSEGRFTATYKFALLHALADHCVEHGEEGSGGVLTVSLDDLALRFAGLYTRQTMPFAGPNCTRPLLQNTNRNKPAKVLTVLRESSPTYGSSAEAIDPDPPVLSEIRRTIVVQPLWKLQTVGKDEQMSFLYENTKEAGIRQITLLLGVAYCFREFHGLIIAMVRDNWERWIRRHNEDILGGAADLHQFLFGSERADLSGYREILLEVQDGKCFFTGSRLTRGSAVDHFIPWSRYPADLGQNMLLTSSSTNSSKSDHLPAEGLLEKWLDFEVARRDVLEEAFRSKGLRQSLRASLAIAEWGYASLARAEGLAWMPRQPFEKLSGRWRDLFDQAYRELGWER